MGSEAWERKSAPSDFDLTWEPLLNVMVLPFVRAVRFPFVVLALGLRTKPSHAGSQFIAALSHSATLILSFIQ